MSNIVRIEKRNGKLLFVLKVTQQKGRKLPDTTLFCLTDLQAIKLTPCASYWSKRYNNLISSVMDENTKVDTLEKLAEYCFLEDSKIINWESINRNYIKR